MSTLKNAVARCSGPLGRRPPWRHNFASSGKRYPRARSSSGRMRGVLLPKGDLRAAGDEAKLTAALTGSKDPVTSSCSSWLPWTHLLQAPKGHKTTIPVSLCLSYVRGRNLVALQESKRIRSYQPCNFNGDIFLSRHARLLLMEEPLTRAENGVLAPGTGSYTLLLSFLDLAQFHFTLDPTNKSTCKHDWDWDSTHLTKFSRSFAPVTESWHPFQKKQPLVLLPVSAVECFCYSIQNRIYSCAPSASSPWSDACLAVIFSRWLIFAAPSSSLPHSCPGRAGRIWGISLFFLGETKGL